MSGINNFKYVFTKPNTVIFLTGVSLSGKSTISQIISSNIQNCTIQNMDIIRLLNIKFEELKPSKERNIFCKYGSCDSYIPIGNGTYSEKNLTKGFEENSKSICSLLTYIIPNLETQGAQNVLFEGVQLNPKIIEKYLRGTNKLVVLLANKLTLQQRVENLYKHDLFLKKRYNPDKLVLIQKHILKQSKDMGKNKVICVQNFNSRSCLNTAKQVLKKLEKLKVIKANK